jgi:hypothetical protein
MSARVIVAEFSSGKTTLWKLFGRNSYEDFDPNNRLLNPVEIWPILRNPALTSFADR